MSQAVRQPAKAIEEIDIPEGSYKPDFELIDKYTSYASELLRLSLFGIGGYGFLVSEVVMKSQQQMASCFGMCLRQHSILLIVGLFSLGLALLLAVWYRLISTSCIHYQVKILRGLQRINSPAWKADSINIEAEEKHLHNLREKQATLSKRCKLIMQCSSFCLAAGYIIVVVIFYLMINSTM